MCHMTHPKTMKTIGPSSSLRAILPGPFPYPLLSSLRHWHSSFILYLNHPLHVDLFFHAQLCWSLFIAYNFQKYPSVRMCPQKLVPPPLPDPTKPLEVRNYSRYSFPSFSTDPSFICILLFHFIEGALGKVSYFQM